jgi:DNA-binding MarR family transcriptional regulator
MIKRVPAAKPAVVADDRREAIRTLYMESLQLVERLHRRLLDVIKDEFDRNGRSDINAIQALLLFNIGNAELTAGELRSRGYYLGSNVSYNLKKLVDLGFINHQRSRIDRRSVRVSLTPKGQAIAEVVAGSTNAISARSSRSAASTGRVQADEPRPAASGPFLERHHRLSHVVDDTFRPFRDGATGRPGTVCVWARRSLIVGNPVVLGPDHGKLSCRDMATLPPYSHVQRSNSEGLCDVSVSAVRLVSTTAWCGEMLTCSTSVDAIGRESAGAVKLINV